MTQHFLTIGVSEKGGEGRKAYLFYLSMRQSIDDSSKKYSMLIFSKGLIYVSRWSFVLQTNRQEVTEREREYQQRMFLCLCYFFVVNGSELSLNCVSSIVDSHRRRDDLL